MFGGMFGRKTPSSSGASPTGENSPKGGSSPSAGQLILGLALPLLKELTPPGQV